MLRSGYVVLLHAISDGHGHWSALPSLVASIPLLALFRERGSKLLRFGDMSCVEKERALRADANIHFEY